MAGGYTNVRASYCRDAADYLTSCFAWAVSPEGTLFWSAISERLKAIGNGDRPTEPLFAKLVGMDNPEIKRLQAIVELRDEEIKSLAGKLVAANKKLMVSDWVNSSLPRASP